MEKKTKYQIIIGVAILIIAVAALYAFFHFKQLYDGQQVYKQLQEKYVSQSDSVTIPVDFKSLQRENPDIYAWITLEGTSISYPIVQGTKDDTYYLEHTVSGAAGYPGSIFTERASNKDFSDFNTVIYGHNMKDGSMFGCLHDLEDGAVFDKCGELLIYTPNSILHYKIFAAYVYDHRHLLRSFDYNTENGRLAYLQEVYSSTDIRSHYDRSIDVSSFDKIITLSTCMSNNEDERYLVQGVLTKVEQKTPVQAQ